MEQILRDQMLEDMRKVVQIPSVSSDKVNVEKAGFYNLAFKAMQSDKNSTYYRKLLVNGEVPFEEAKYMLVSCSAFINYLSKKVQ